MGGETLTKGISKARIAGAIAAGTGGYILVRVLQKTAGDILRSILSTEPGGEMDSFFGVIFGKFGFAPGVKPTQEQLLALDPAAVSIGLLTGGMVLAGLNPGDILKGIGEIIPG